MSITPSQLTMAPAPLVISNKRYQAVPLSDVDYAEITEYLQDTILSRARSHAELITDSGERSEFLQAAIKASLSVEWGTEEGFKIINRPEGFARMAYQMIKHNHSQVLFESFKREFLDRAFVTKNIEETNRVYLKQNTSEAGKEDASDDTKSGEPEVVDTEGTA